MPQYNKITENDETLIRLLASYEKPFDATTIHMWLEHDDDARLQTALTFLGVQPNSRRIDQPPRSFPSTAANAKTTIRNENRR